MTYETSTDLTLAAI